MYLGEAVGRFRLKQYDQAIEWDRRAIAINPSTNPWVHFNLIAALASAGREAEAHEALQNYTASVPSGLKTIAALKAVFARAANTPRYRETLDRFYAGLRKAGMPEG